MSSKRTLVGTLEHSDLGSGAWTLVDGDGTRWSLAGSIPDKLAGRRVEVVGREAGLVGFAMTGPTLQVKSIKAA